jgi:hypothetical protein
MAHARNFGMFGGVVPKIRADICCLGKPGRAKRTFGSEV